MPPLKLTRIEKAKSANVPITNYGLVMTGCRNMLYRAIAPLGKMQPALS
jgi:hypothetical protein